MSKERRFYIGDRPAAKLEGEERRWRDGARGTAGGRQQSTVKSQPEIRAPTGPAAINWASWSRSADVLGEPLFLRWPAAIMAGVWSVNWAWQMPFDGQMSAILGPRPGRNPLHRGGFQV
jgi:hypothetical protein